MPSIAHVAKLTLLVAIAHFTVACEALPVVHVSVVHDEAASPQLREISAAEEPWPDVSGEPIPSALVVVSDDDDDASQSVQDDAASYGEQLPPTGRGGALGDFPVRMQTNENGHAKYRELRMQPVPFVGFGLLHRRVAASAAGYRPMSIPIEIGTGSYVLVVPMQRER